MSGGADPVTRHFLNLGGRAVHYRRLGSGPPVLLIHSSPASSEYLIPFMRQLAPHFTCFAFDTPSFGDSDRLTLRHIKIADLADATAAAMQALGLPACPVFGTHTGAAIATELGRRHPHLVRGVVADGITIFNAQEQADILSGYLMKIAPDALGGHFTSLWTRFRDQLIWFPWYRKRAANLLTADIPPAASIQMWVMMMLRAGNSYRTAYKAAFAYGDEAVTAARELTVPAVFLARKRDMNFPHLAHLTGLKPEQRVLPLGNDEAAWYGAIVDAMRGFAGDETPPPDPVAAKPTARIRRAFTGPAGAQLFVRYGGAKGVPLVLLHDVPGSSGMVGREMDRVARERPVYAFDIPGCGESDPLSLEKPGVADFAASLLAAIDRLGLTTFDIQASGYSAALAVELARHAQGRVGSVSLDHVIEIDPSDRAAMAERLTPAIEPVADGSHFYRTWLMLRDAQVYRPWYEANNRHLMRTEGNFDAAFLHDWTVEVQKQPRTYGLLMQAVLDYPLADHMRNLSASVSVDGADLALLDAAQ
jgi:pimeloyl-ACP methyl ester carboxylesterase